jgi:hypothetical protein
MFWSLHCRSFYYVHLLLTIWYLQTCLESMLSQQNLKRLIKSRKSKNDRQYYVLSKKEKNKCPTKDTENYWLNNTNPTKTITFGFTAFSHGHCNVCSSMHGFGLSRLVSSNFSWAILSTFCIINIWLVEFYFQIQLKKDYLITGVVTQGRNGCCKQWVTKYRVFYGDDCNHLKVLDGGKGTVT